MASPVTCSELSVPSACCCDEDRQPCPVPEQSSSGPDEALRTAGLPLPVPLRHQLPASAATSIASQAADPAAVQQHTFTSW